MFISYTSVILRKTFSLFIYTSFIQSSQFFCLFRVEKYRPKTLNDLISHKDIISTSKFVICFLMLFVKIVYFLLTLENNTELFTLPQLAQIDLSCVDVPLFSIFITGNRKSFCLFITNLYILYAATLWNLLIHIQYVFMSESVKVNIYTKLEFQLLIYHDIILCMNETKPMKQMKIMART